MYSQLPGGCLLHWGRACCGWIPDPTWRLCHSLGTRLPYRSSAGGSTAQQFLRVCCGPRPPTQTAGCSLGLENTAIIQATSCSDRTREHPFMPKMWDTWVSIHTRREALPGVERLWPVGGTWGCTQLWSPSYPRWVWGLCRVFLLVLIWFCTLQLFMSPCVHSLTLSTVHCAGSWGFSGEWTCGQRVSTNKGCIISAQTVRGKWSGDSQWGPMRDHDMQAEGLIQ